MLVALGTLLVWAQPPEKGSTMKPPRPPHGPPGLRPPGPPHLSLHHLDKMREPLELDESQYQALKKLIVDSKREHIKTMGELHLLRFEMMTLMHEAQPDATKVKALFEQVSGLEKELHWNRLEMMLAAKKVLSEEQQRKLRARLPGPPPPPDGGPGPGF